ncbi:MAG: type II toxin-antitoxin system HigB family toxin [Kangiellaceae bacterium]|nr:type II toxin-antitoxin system HigB family toxin [Kangiellaceae bacterium]MCW8997424.1 type II toxin-antitoxin system HigB family toxin [Kangiellaceae bacterium]MCW9015524.1 type II toxin-antitoxin system HigB family toxin [Kangiellaceae bacterium]
MKVVATNRISEAGIRYPAAHNHLIGWYQILSQGDFYSEQDLRATFGDMRGFNLHFKFPIPDTTLLVHTLINFESQVAFIEDIRPGAH